jgi:hypothetical protein
MVMLRLFVWVLLTDASLQFVILFPASTSQRVWIPQWAEGDSFLLHFTFAGQAYRQFTQLRYSSAHALPRLSRTDSLPSKVTMPSLMEFGVL